MMKKINFEHFFFLLFFINSSFLYAGDKEIDIFTSSENPILSAAQKKYIPLIEQGDFFTFLEAHAALVAVFKKEHEAVPRELSIEIKKKKSLWKTIFSSTRVKQDKNLII